MKGFAAWGATILGLAVITTVFELLLPQGKTRKVITAVMATLAVSVIVAPLPGLFNGGGFSFDISGSVHTDGEYLAYIDGVKSDIISHAAQDYLNERGYSDVGVKVRLDGFNVVSAEVYFLSIGITAEDGHINRSVIIRLLAEYLGISEEAVMAYG